MALKKLLLGSLLFFVGTVTYAETESVEKSEIADGLATKIMYVKDNGDYFLRDNPSAKSALRGSVKAGDQVKVLDQKNGFIYIEDAKGRQKWIAASDVQEQPSYKYQVETLAQQNAELKKKLENIDSEQARELKELKIKYNSVHSELEEAKKSLANQKEKLSSLTDQNQKLSQRIENSEEEKQIRWAKVGAMLVGAGLLAGLILVYLPWPQRRRKDIW